MVWCRGWSLLRARNGIALTRVLKPRGGGDANRRATPRSGAGRIEFSGARRRRRIAGTGVHRFRGGDRPPIATPGARWKLGSVLSLVLGRRGIRHPQCTPWAPQGMPKAKQPARQRKTNALDQMLAVTRRAPCPVTHLPQIKLPWTKTSDLSANSRLHWRKRHALVKAQKRTADALAREAGWHKVRIPDDAKISINLTFCPPFPRRGP